jgi:hypothetical protein
MPVELIIGLDHGLWRDDGPQREASVRALNGADEARVAELASGATPAECATALIAAATTRIGRIAPIAPDDARALTIGDRERLLLALHRLSFGRIEARAQCRQPDCGDTLEIGAAIDDLLAPPAEAPARPENTINVEVGRHTWTAAFRLPNGGDQEQAARLAATDARRAADAILRRCVLGVTDERGQAVAPDKALDALHAPLAEAFARLDPQAETRLRLVCPACGASTEALLDAASYVLAQLTRPSGIFAEVDRIARAYHWAERDILALPLARRRRYLALIAHAEGVP